MKKVIGLLLILTLAAALLAGCGGGSSTSRKELMKGQWMSSYGWSYDLREDGSAASINVYGTVMREDGKWSEDEVKVSASPYKVVSVDENTLVLDDDGSQETWTRVK